MHGERTGQSGKVRGEAAGGHPSWQAEPNPSARRPCGDTQHGELRPRMPRKKRATPRPAGRRHKQVGNGGDPPHERSEPKEPRKQGCNRRPMAEVTLTEMVFV